MSFAHQSGSGGGAAVLTYDNPVASAPGDAMSQGVDNDVARADHRHAREAFAAPAIVLGTAAAAGAAGTLVRSDATIVAFDATVPTTAAAGDAAAAGAAAVAARRDHVHGMPAADPAAATAGFRTLGAGAQQAAAGNHSHAGGATSVRKTATETVNNSTTLQDDDELKLALAANEVWTFDLFIRLNSGTTPDIKLAFTVPAAATLLSWAAYEYDPSGTFVDTTPTEASGTAHAYKGYGANSTIWIRGVVHNGANAGNLQLQWAQNTLNASNTQVLVDSWLLATKLA